MKKHKTGRGYHNNHGNAGRKKGQKDSKPRKRAIRGDSVLFREMRMELLKHPEKSLAQIAEENNATLVKLQKEFKDVPLDIRNNEEIFASLGLTKETLFKKITDCAVNGVYTDCDHKAHFTVDGVAQICKNDGKPIIITTTVSKFNPQLTLEYQKEAAKLCNWYPAPKSAITTSDGGEKEIPVVSHIKND